MFQDHDFLKMRMLHPSMFCCVDIALQKLFYLWFHVVLTAGLPAIIFFETIHPLVDLFARQRVCTATRK